MELAWSSGNPEQTFSFSPDLLDTPPPTTPPREGAWDDSESPSHLQAL